MKINVLVKLPELVAIAMPTDVLLVPRQTLVPMLQLEIALQQKDVC